MNLSKFEDTSFPEKEDFYGSLNMEGITEDNLRYARRL